MPSTVWMKMNKDISSLRNYLIINKILLSAFSLFVLYFVIIAVTGIDYPVSSVYNKADIVSSTGLQRSIGYCIQFNFSESLKLNVSGPLVLLFFVIQIIARAIIMLNSSKIKSSCFYFDLLFTIALFVITFRKFLILPPIF